MTVLLLSLMVLLSFGLSAYLLLREYQAKGTVQKREQDISRRMYELAILKELGDRVGYSLNVQQIIDIITNSLHQFIEYSVVSYMLLGPEKVVFKIHLERSVHRHFITDIRERMLGSLGALLNREFDKKMVQEVLSGAILVEELDEPVRSFFNIPLVIDEKVVGVLTVADTKGGLYKEEEMTILYKIIQQASKAVTSLQGVVRTEQAKLNAMVESMADGVVMTDADYRILVVNPAAKRVIGLEGRQEVTIFDFIDNLGGKVDMRGRLEESVKLNKSYTSDTFLLRDKFYQAFIFPVQMSGALGESTMLGGVVIFHDVTHEVELEHVRDDFTSMLVHELRTPLDVIKKFSAILKDPSIKEKPETKKDYLKSIFENSSGMLDLVNEILDVAKLQAGKFEINRTAADIKAVIDNRVEFFALSAKDKKITLNSETHKDVPASISFDPERVKEVLNNLISNALKFTPEGGAVAIRTLVHHTNTPLVDELSALKIELPAALPEESLKPVPDSVLVLVTDTGSGVPAEKIGELFSKFKQLSGSDQLSGKKGSGLGLAIAKGIVEEHRGKIGVVSKVGVGSTFYFVLPLDSPKV